MAGAGSFFFSSLGPARLRRLRRLLLLLSPILPLSLSPATPFTPFHTLLLRSSFSLLFLLLPFFSLLPPLTPTFTIASQTSPPTRRPNQRQSVSAPLPQWLRSSPTHAAAPAGPAALPSAGQVELPESPIHPPPPIPAQETSSCWEVEGGWVGFSSGF